MMRRQSYAVKRLLLLAIEDGLVLHLVTDAASLDADEVLEVFFRSAGAWSAAQTLIELARDARSSLWRKAGGSTPD